MPWLHLVAYFFAGVFLANAIPHFVAGTMGRALQSPFAKPPGQGLSSSVTNAAWGSFNLVIAYLLIFKVGEFDVRSTTCAGVFGVGLVLKAVTGARQFGKFNGGNDSRSP